MKKLLAVLLCAVMVLTPVLSLAESWADFATRANTLMAAGVDETITLAEAVDASAYGGGELEWLNGGTLTIIGQNGVTDFVSMLIGNASVRLQNVTVDNADNYAIGIIVTASGGEATLHVDADSKITGHDAGVVAHDLDAFTLFNDGQITSAEGTGMTFQDVLSALLANNGLIQGEEMGMYTSDVGDILLTNTGKIVGLTNGALRFDVSDSVEVHNDGILLGGNGSGIGISEVNIAILLNNGEIIGAGTGVGMNWVDIVSIINAGKITGVEDNGVYVGSGTDVSLDNDGQIAGGHTGVSAYFLGSLAFSNQGEVVGVIIGADFYEIEDVIFSNQGLLQGGYAAAVIQEIATPQLNNTGDMVSPGVYDPDTLAEMGMEPGETLPGAVLRLHFTVGSDAYNSIPALTGLRTQAEVQQALSSGAVTAYLLQSGMFNGLPDGAPVVVGVSANWEDLENEEDWWYASTETLTVGETPVAPVKPLHNRGKANGIAYSKEWGGTTYFGISLDSFFLNGNDERVYHRSEFQVGKGNAITGTLRTNKNDAGMQYLVTPEALENFRRANVRTLVLRNGSEHRDPRTTIDIIAVLDALEALPQEIRDDIRYLLFDEKGMDGEALYVDWQGNVKTMDGEIVRTYIQSTIDSFPDFGRN